jgi:hypothetical protein
MSLEDVDSNGSVQVQLKALVGTVMNLIVL